MTFSKGQFQMHINHGLLVLVAKVFIRKNSCVHKISQNKPFALCLLSKEHYKMKSFVGFILSLYFSLGKFA